MPLIPEWWKPRAYGPPASLKVISKSCLNHKVRWGGLDNRTTSPLLLFFSPHQMQAGSPAKRYSSQVAFVDGDGQDRKLMIENKVVLITGVSSGIGQEAAQLLAERGARVFGTVRYLDSANPIAKVEFVLMDVTDDNSVKDGTESVLESAGRIDILINNAGYSVAGGLEETSIEEARQLFETNFFGALRVIQAVLPSMRRNGYGRIVNISSMLGVLPGPFRAGCMSRANMRWRVTPKHWITRLERSASAQRWLSPSIQRPKSTRTKKPCKQPFQPTRSKNSG